MSDDHQALALRVGRLEGSVLDLVAALAREIGTRAGDADPLSQTPQEFLSRVQVRAFSGDVEAIALLALRWLVERLTAAEAVPFEGRTVRPGPLHRVGPLAAADYDEAIDELIQARSQLVPDGRGCVVCWADDHQAFECRHNALVVARRFVAATSVWKCFHCGEVLKDEVAARAHFGPELSPTPVCAAATSRVVAVARQLGAGACLDDGTVLVDDLKALNAALDELDRAAGVAVETDS